MPHRIQRKRVKGWRMPDGAVNVTRPGRWGNPFKVGAPHPKHGFPMSAKETVDLFEDGLFRYSHFDGSMLDYLVDLCTINEIQNELKGKNLACWCKPDQPCHADVLLKIANDEVYV